MTVRPSSRPLSEYREASSSAPDTLVIHEVAYHENDLLPDMFNGTESSEEAQSWWSYFKKTTWPFERPVTLKIYNYSPFFYAVRPVIGWTVYLLSRK